ncbi:MAG: ABC transporter permease [Lysobacterales bacterium]|jgi:putative ABC transport system permease protein
MKDIGPILRTLLRNRLGAFLIALQIALTLAVVTNAAFIIEKRVADVTRPSGLDEPNTAIFITTLFDPGVDQREQFRKDLDAMRALPGVVAVTPIQSIPVSGSGWGEDLYTTPEMTSDQSISFGNFMVDEQGLEALDLKLLAGRNFRPGEMVERNLDSMQTSDVIIVSQALADALFPDGDALGKTVFDEPDGKQPMEIIGIYDHMQNAWPHSDNVNRTALMPMINAIGGYMVFLVRAEPGQRDAVMAAGEEYLSKNRSRVVQHVRSFEEQKRRTYGGDIAMIKLMTAVITALAAVTGLGIVGLARFSVTQRRKQIGTRRALGATRFDIVRYFMVENWLITSIGLVIGIAGAVGLNWFLDTEYSTGRMPVWYLPAGMVTLWLLGQLAVLWPARRAADIPPALATRSV